LAQARSLLDPYAVLYIKDLGNTTKALELSWRFDSQIIYDRIDNPVFSLSQLFIHCGW
jgi:hypothetical protein